MELEAVADEYDHKQQYHKVDWSPGGQVHLCAYMNQFSPPVLIRQMMANSHRQIPKLTMELERLIVENFISF